MSYGLAPRPVLPAEETAAVMAAVEEMLKVEAEQVLAIDTVPNWRFSGRWFNAGPYTMRRPLRPM